MGDDFTHLSARLDLGMNGSALLRMPRFHKKGIILPQQLRANLFLILAMGLGKQRRAGGPGERGSTHRDSDQTSDDGAGLRPQQAGALENVIPDGDSLFG